MGKHCDCQRCTDAMDRAEKAEDELKRVVGLENEIERLRSELIEARRVLQDLRDEQNGPPLLRREKEWQAAMDAAESVLSAGRGEG
jgi:hypothetical protein